jgi:tetratricopeptide (TPR) repeat protein
MQNLTARYNYIYNSNVLLKEYEEDLLTTYVDNYEKILPVYLDPEPQVNLLLSTGVANKKLDEIILKGQAIINDKSFSNYIDDAYMLLGKAQFLKGNYFTASEYFDYVARTYSTNAKVYILALNWKARSQMVLNNMAVADKILDSALRVADNLKNDLPEPLATTAQMRIYQHRYREAIVLLETAIRKADDKQLRIRWQYILSQLQEKEKDLQNAFINYNKVENSNAPFEMYFHANLNRIKLKALISGYKIDQEKQLLPLLKDDKNADYADQIYYQIGEMFSEEKNYPKAEDYYLKSAKTSTSNLNQKGLSFLKIADLNFKELKNYVKAKQYYDSTILVLPKTFPDYDNIAKKAINLQYLTDRYAVIAREDTLQYIAKSPENERAGKIKNWLKKTIIPTESPQNIVGPNLTSTLFADQGQNAFAVTPSNTTFYFNNNAAISNGFSDFKKRWGTRKLEDNWRQSLRSSAQESNQILSGGNVANNITVAVDTLKQKNTTQEDLEKTYLDKLPLTNNLLAESNQKIIDSYYEIASFYQQELNDKEEANKIFNELLTRFPENSHLASIYYSLYLNYLDVDNTKAENYKQIVLQKFPESNFAKTILDPRYIVKQNALENEANENYNKVYTSFANKDYSTVIKQSIESNTTFPNNDIAPQYAYLKSIAVGRTQKVDALLTEFNSIVNQYPEDKIVTPLVKEHLKFIAENLDEFKQRKFALIDFDPNAERFVSPTYPDEKKNVPVVKNIEVAQINTEKAEEKAVEKVAEKTITKVDEKPGISTVNGIKTDGIFNNAVSDTYYYVLNVNDASLTLSSSRFGIGQFNRSNFPQNDLAHKLIEFDNNQLIYISSFVDLEDAKLYEKIIAPQLNKIMKVPANIYTGFIISKENFDKLKSSKLITQYLEFYKNSY